MQIIKLATLNIGLNVLKIKKGANQIFRPSLKALACPPTLEINIGRTQ